MLHSHQQPSEQQCPHILSAPLLWPAAAPCAPIANAVATQTIGHAVTGVHSGQDLLDGLPASLPACLLRWKHGHTWRGRPCRFMLDLFTWPKFEPCTACDQTQTWNVCNWRHVMYHRKLAHFLVCQRGGNRRWPQVGVPVGRGGARREVRGVPPGEAGAAVAGARHPSPGPPPLPGQPHERPHRPQPGAGPPGGLPLCLRMSHCVSCRLLTPRSIHKPADAAGAD